MAEILETVMLVCFGCSWPISLIKNYKAKTAKATSPLFIILILTGYIAGIASKFVAGKIYNTKEIFVLAVYFINFVFVSANLILYFRNKKLDRIAEKQELNHKSESM